MSLRARLMDDIKAAMKAGQSERVAQLRAITAKVKDLDVAARAKDAVVSDEDILLALRSMIKSRSESVEMYTKGNRPELAEKEEREIETIRSYLPAELDDDTVKTAIKEAVAEVKAESMKDMGRVMAVLKKRFGAALNAAKASAFVKEHLG
ncbi:MULTISPECIES: GatB/YqeY domain-containing protein [unclassified Saccharibacter]|uniref:GatB/YqeY domain-containing protein n=1 Tax=unclassified Saccharibacter TaxID=2648722 RepID=UPI0013264FA7|nr:MULTISPECIES: GatB/YqeY domain-containing protein [unclassified Saccharibacter]MXV35023.1 GatB/YqeY domain-containing protein [Saccharibacter sp. EH611]MXV57430.1 GatB/YqeY domain-containing protein [Saccharibacter sp. EH70]MXV64709.1 GatB/YqeY domain-containing protein [Saccharibacter sp. EH60]